MAKVKINVTSNIKMLDAGKIISVISNFLAENIGDDAMCNILFVLATQMLDIKEVNTFSHEYSMQAKPETEVKAIIVECLNCNEGDEDTQSIILAVGAQIFEMPVYQFEEYLKK